MATTNTAKVVGEVYSLLHYLRSHPQFGGLKVDRALSHNGLLVAVPAHPVPRWYRVSVHWVHKAELGRFTYLYQDRLRVYTREALIEIMHRDIVMDRLGVQV